MSNYNLINKDICVLESSNPIKSVEYMIVREPDSEKSFAIIKIENQTSNKLQKIVIEVEFLDMDNEVIDVESYDLDNINIPPFKSKISHKKIEVSNNCFNIRVTTCSAETDKQTWENDRWTYKEKYAPLIEANSLYETSLLECKNLRFPYFLSVGLIIAFVLVIILVFVMINS